MQYGEGEIVGFYRVGLLAEVLVGLRMTDMTTSSEDKRLDNTRIFWWMTLIYAGLVTALSAFAIGWWYSGKQNGIGEIVDEIKLNSFGDFIAGVISPLALLWLIATVRLQSKELALQRQEIALNRKVMEEQAQAAEDQVKQSELQAHAMREQIRLQSLVANANYKVSLFDQRFELLRHFEGLDKRWHQISYHELRDVIDKLFKVKFVFGDDVYERILPVMDSFKSWLVAYGYFEGAYGEGGFEKYVMERNALSELPEASIWDDGREGRYKFVMRAMVWALDGYSRSDLLKSMESAMIIKSDIVSA